jgi:hypothetical protein
MEHEAAWARFEAEHSTSGKKVEYNNIPWPKDRYDLVKEGWDDDKIKAHLRVLFLRWHPDKWQQRFSSVPDNVMTQVTTVVQMISAMKAK